MSSPSKDLSTAQRNILQNAYDNNLEILKLNNKLKDKILAQENEELREEKESELLSDEFELMNIIEDKKRERDRIRYKMKRKEYLLQENLNLENELTYKENRFKEQINKIKNEKDLQLQQIQDSHKLNIKELELENKKIDDRMNERLAKINSLNNQRNLENEIERKKIEYDFQDNIKREQLESKKKLDKINDNIDRIKSKYKIKMIKNNNHAKEEEKKINNEFEINELKLKNEYTNKMYDQEYYKTDAMFKQNLEKQQKDFVLQMMMNQIMLSQSVESNNNKKNK